MTPTIDALRSLAACADHARDAVYAMELAGIGGDVRDGAVLRERRKRRAGK